MLATYSHIHIQIILTINLSEHVLKQVYFDKVSHALCQYVANNPGVKLHTLDHTDLVTSVTAKLDSLRRSAPI